MWRSPEAHVRWAGGALFIYCHMTCKRGCLQIRAAVKRHGSSLRHHQSLHPQKCRALPSRALAFAGIRRRMVICKFSSDGVTCRGRGGGQLCPRSLGGGLPFAHQQSKTGAPWGCQISQRGDERLLSPPPSRPFTFRYKHPSRHPFSFHSLCSVSTPTRNLQQRRHLLSPAAPTTSPSTASPPSPPTSPMGGNGGRHDRRQRGARPSPRSVGLPYWQLEAQPPPTAPPRGRVTARIRTASDGMG